MVVYNICMTKQKIYNYKGVRVNALDIPVSGSRGNERGKKSSGTKRSYYHSFSSMFNENAPKNLIVMYDIPHELKKERDWFRRHLIKFGYEMIQKSVWVYPYECEDELLFVAEMYYVQKYIEILTVEKLLHENLLKRKFRL